MKNSSDPATSGRKIIVTVAVVTTVCVLSIVIAGLTSLVSLAERIHPMVGQFVFWSVCAALGFLVLYALIAYARMPASLVPAAKDSANYEKYLAALRARLRMNPKTRAHSLDTIEEIEQALSELSAEADSVVRGTASTVFLSTALMQNGRLDALIVLFTQIRMIWRVARIYVQRPSPRDLVRLYANVAGTCHVDRARDQRRDPRAQRCISAARPLHFERRRERVPDPACRRSGATLLRADFRRIARRHPQIRHRRCGQASWPDRARKRCARCRQNLGNNRACFHRERRCQSGGHCKCGPRLGRQNLTLASSGKSNCSRVKGGSIRSDGTASAEAAVK